MKYEAEIGILGGTGLYELLSNPKEIYIKTRYGAPSAMVKLGEIAGREIAFIPRHGDEHQYPPHKIPYLANISVFKELGVKKIISPCAVGSLKAEIKPGDFVICDQFFDRTKGREDTFFNGPKTAHISAADPYCPELRKIAVDSCQKLGINCQSKGTVVVVQGPRFSTRAESKFFAALKLDVINMTQYPEVILARELSMCYVNISLVTDYDVGLEGNDKIKPVDIKEVVKIVKQNEEKVKKLINEMIRSLPRERNCKCPDYINEAFV